MPRFKHRYSRKKRIRHDEQARLQASLCEQVPENSDIDDEEVEQNQYLWAGYIRDLGAS